MGISKYGTQSLEIYFEAKKHEDNIIKILFFPDSKLFATCSLDGKLLIWDLINKCTVNSFIIEDSINSVSFLKDSNYLIFCTECASINYCRADSPNFETKINGNLLEHTSISVSSDERYLAYGCKMLVLYDLAKSKSIAKCPNYNFKCSCLKFSANGVLLGCGYFSGEICILEVPHLTLKYRFYFSKSEIQCLTFSLSCNLIGYATAGQVKIQFLKKDEIVYKESVKDIYAMEFCLNDEKFVYSDDKYNINIINKKFVKEATVEFNEFVFGMMVVGDNENLILYHGYTNWSCLNLKTCKRVFESKSKKEFEKWASNQKTLKYRAIVKLSQFVLG